MLLKLILDATGGWDDWVGWSECSSSCGVGVQTRSRACNKPLPRPARLCTGITTESKQCKNDCLSGTFNLFSPNSELFLFYSLFYN